MEVYAAFYTYTDYEIGRVVNYLEQIDQLDNTLIVLVLGDNGASKGGGQSGSADVAAALKGEERLDAIDKAQSDPEQDELINNDYPIGWAMAANTPFRYWKADANTEGGTRNPVIISYPKVIKNKGQVRNQYGHVIDILPTTLELISGKVPDAINGYKQQPIEGTSLAYAIDNANAPSRHTVQYYVKLLVHARSIRMDGKQVRITPLMRILVWALIPLTQGVAADGSKVDFSKDVWELYNLNDDFNEQVNLASKYPEKLKELQACIRCGGEEV